MQSSLDGAVAAFLAKPGNEITKLSEGASAADRDATAQRSEQRRERYGRARLNGATVSDALDDANRY